MLGVDRCKRLARLNTRKGRDEAGRVLLDSRPVIAEALALGLVEELLVDEDCPDALFGLAGTDGVTQTPVRADQLSRIADAMTPAGVVAVSLPPAPGDESLLGQESFRTVLLDDLSDPGNVGTIARCALAFGVDFLLVGEGTVDMLAPKTLRASAGALLHLPMIKVQRSEIDFGGAQVLRTVPRGGADVSRLTPPARTILWLGNEARGVGEPGKDWDVLDVSIPIAPGVESLNVATAAAICLHALATSSG